MRRWLWVWAPPVAEMILVFLVQTVPNLQIPTGQVTSPDKQLHVITYGVLSVLFMRALADARWAGLTWLRAFQAWGFAAAYGLFDEVHQRFVPGRSGSIGDWLADVAGAAVSVLVLCAVRVRRSREV